MSKNHNYAKMYNKNDSAIVKDVHVDPVVEDETAVQETSDIPEVPVVPEVEAAFGIVTGCEKLNVRTNPNKNSAVVYVVEANTELNIDLDKSTDEWCYVSNAAGIEGFCMKTFIRMKK